MPARGDPVDQRREGDNGGDVVATGCGGEDVTAGEGDAPEHQAGGVDAGEPGRGDMAAR